MLWQLTLWNHLIGLKFRLHGYHKQICLGIIARLLNNCEDELVWFTKKLSLFKLKKKKSYARNKKIRTFDLFSYYCNDNKIRRTSLILKTLFLWLPQITCLRRHFNYQQFPKVYFFECRPILIYLFNTKQPLLIWNTYFQNAMDQFLKDFFCWLACFKVLILIFRT